MTTHQQPPSMPVIPTLPPHVILAVHGIRTPTATGGWIRTFLTYLRQDARFANADFESGRYGYVYGVLAWLRIIRFFPGQQSKWIDLMIERLTDLSLEHPNHPIDILAHSYGTYICYEAIRRMALVKVRTFIMVAPVIKTAETFEDTVLVGKIQTLYNFCSRGDQVVKHAPPPFGHAGYWGFRPKATNAPILPQPYPDLRVFNVAAMKPKFGHSDWFRPEHHYYQTWLNLLAAG